MTLEQALSMIHAPKGVTSIIAGVLSGDTAPIQSADAANASLATAKEKLNAAKAAQRNCGSDWAYWGYMGDIAYWSCVVDLLEAAAICGDDALPDVPAPRTDGVVMDVQAYIMRFGKEVLKRARSTP